MKDYKALIKEAFSQVVENPVYSQQATDTYFDAGYIQVVDGQELGFNDFCQHMRVQKQALSSLSIEFMTMVQEENIVFTRHHALMQTKEGKPVNIQVMAEFHIKEDKISYCNELTHMLSGDEAERDLGSRR